MPSNLYASCLTLSLLAFVAVCQPAQAWGSFDVKLGKGEEVKVNHGLFGNKNLAVKDRLGDQIEDSQGIFGNKHQKVQLLGNGVEVNQGVFGNKSYSGGTILGDKFATKRSFFGLGPRTTHVDLSGTSALASQLFASKVKLKGASSFGTDAPGKGQNLDPDPLVAPEKFPPASTAVDQTN